MISHRCHLPVSLAPKHNRCPSHSAWAATPFVIPKIPPPHCVDSLLPCTGLIFSTLCCFPVWISSSLYSDSVLEHPPSHHSEAQYSSIPLPGPHSLISLFHSGFDIQFWTILIMDTLLTPLDSDILCGLLSYMHTLLTMLGFESPVPGYPVHGSLSVPYSGSDTLCWAALHICTAFSFWSCYISSTRVPYSPCSDSCVSFCPNTHRCLPCSAPPAGFCTELLYWREERGGESEEQHFLW